MSQIQSTNSRPVKSNSFPFGWLIGLFSVFFVMTLGSYFASPFSSGMRQIFVNLLSLNTTKATWYITRSAGITAYLLLWFSTVLGLAIPTKFMSRLLNGNFIYDFHEYISLLSLGFMGLHVLILLADQYMRFSVIQILFPFLAPYKPFWVGIGVLAFYIIVVATIAFYARKKIGNSTFKFLHGISLLGYLGATAHGFFAGTDSSLAFAQMMYIGSFLVVVFLTAYWLMLAAQKKLALAR